MEGPELERACQQSCRIHLGVPFLGSAVFIPGSQESPWVCLGPLRVVGQHSDLIPPWVQKQFIDLDLTLAGRANSLLIHEELLLRFHG